MAPFGLLAHDESADPPFVHANPTARQRFGYDWDEFVGLPSRGWRGQGSSAPVHGRGAPAGLRRGVPRSGGAHPRMGRRLTLRQRLVADLKHCLSPTSLTPPFAPGRVPPPPLALPSCRALFP